MPWNCSCTCSTCRLVSITIYHSSFPSPTSFFIHHHTSTSKVKWNGDRLLSMKFTSWRRSLPWIVLHIQACRHLLILFVHSTCHWDQNSPVDHHIYPSLIIIIDHLFLLLHFPTLGNEQHSRDHTVTGDSIPHSNHSNHSPTLLSMAFRRSPSSSPRWDWR